MENFNTVPDKGTFGGSVEVVNQNFSLAQQEMEVLQNKCENESARAIEAENSLRQLYNNLQQSQPIPVTSLPATGEAGKIYRLAGTNSYADYMYAEGALTTPIKMAEYDNAIDDEPTAGSNNLVKSGGVYSLFKNFVDGLYIESETGNLVEDEKFVITDFVEVIAGTYVDYQYINPYPTTSVGPVASIAFYDSNKYLLSTYIMQSDSVKKDCLAPNNTKYARASFRIDCLDRCKLMRSADNVVIWEPYYIQQSTEEKIQIVDSKIENFQRNSLLYDNDVIVANSNAIISDFISVIPTSSIDWIYGKEVENGRITLYDENKCMLTGAYFRMNSGYHRVLRATDQHWVTLFNKTRFIRATFNKDYIDDAKIIVDGIVVYEAKAVKENEYIAEKANQRSFDILGIDNSKMTGTSPRAGRYFLYLTRKVYKDDVIKLVAKEGYKIGISAYSDELHDYSSPYKIYETDSMTYEDSFTVGNVNVRSLFITVDKISGDFSGIEEARNGFILTINGEQLGDIVRKIEKSTSDNSDVLLVNSKVFKSCKAAWGNKNHVYESWPNGGVFADGDKIVMIYNSSSAHVAKDLVSDVIMRKKTTLGDWDEKKIILEHTANVGYGNPSCCMLPNGDYIVIASILTSSTVSNQIMAIKIIKSSDKGETWTDIGNVQVNGADVMDECMMSLFCTSTGKLISFVGGTNNCKFIASDDFGETWRYVGESTGEYTLEAAFYERDNGEILSILRKDNNTPALIKINSSLTEYEVLYNFGVFNFPAFYNPTSIMKMLDGKLYLLAGSRQKDSDNKFLLIEAIMTEEDLLANNIKSKVILKSNATSLMDWGYAQAVIADDGTIYGYFYDAKVAGIPQIYEMIGC